MKRYFRATIGILAMAFVSMLSSCSNTDYVNAIPKQATAIISVDAAQMSGVGSTLVLKTLLKTTDLGNTGIDLSQKVYLFETAEGNLGVCAAVHDTDLLSKALAKAGGNVEEKRGYSFALVGGAWLAGYSDDVMLVLGPVNPGDKASAINQMARFLSQGEDEGAASSQIFQTLDTIQSSMAMVAQASAMPNQLVMPFTLGAPKDADPSQIMVSAKISISKGVMVIDGSTFSYNKKINDALKESYASYRPVKGRYIQSMPANAACGMFVNVDGAKFLNIMRANRGLQAMLAGINAAIDMDNIIKSVDGEMAVITPSYADGHIAMSMAAELAHSNWLADIDYWKQSVPQGGKLLDWKPNAYRYTDGKTSFCFGVTADKQFYSGSNPDEAEKSIVASPNGISPMIADQVKGSKFALVANISALTGSNASAVASMVRPIFGNVETILYKVK